MLLHKIRCILKIKFLGDKIMKKEEEEIPSNRVHRITNFMGIVIDERQTSLRDSKKEDDNRTNKK